jgi:uncharacterized protein (DUF58 family)
MTVKQTVVVTSAAFLAIAALALQIRQLYFMAAVVFALPAVAFAFCLLGIGGLEWKREVSERAFEGDEVRVGLRVRNKARLPRFFLWISDTLPSWFSMKGDPDFVVQTLWPGESVEATYEATAEKRGVYRLGPVGTLVTDPLGLFSMWRRYDVPGETVIYPRPLPLRTTDLIGSHSLGLTEAEKLASAGSGSDFYGIRDYRPGDERRRIHWKSTARLGKLAVIEYQQGSAEDVVIVLDLKQGTEVGRGKDTTLEYAVKAAASLAAHAVGQGAAVGLAATAEDGPRWLTASDAEDLYEVYEFLARAKADGREPVSVVVERAERTVGPGTTVLVVTSECDPELAGQIARWSARRASVGVLLMDAAAFSAQAQDEEGGSARRPAQAQEGRAEAYAEALLDAGARAEIVRPGDDIASALRSIWHARR